MRVKRALRLIRGALALGQTRLIDDIERSAQTLDTLFERDSGEAYEIRETEEVFAVLRAVEQHPLFRIIEADLEGGVRSQVLGVRAKRRQSCYNN